MQLYTNLKIFHYQDKLDSLPREAEQSTAPIHIRIKPTNICNHNCSYCAYRASDMQLGKDMVIKDKIPAKKMAEIVEDIIEMGVKAVTFSGGGEPFCYPHLAETAQALADGNVSIAALTNGSLLTGETAEIFAHKGTWIRISMDGWDGPSYAKYRSVPEDEFNKVLKNIENFKSLKGKCFLGANFIINKDNADHVFEMGQRLKDLGVDSLKFSPCIVSNSGKENNDYHDPLFNKIKEQTQRVVADLSDADFEVFDSYHRSEVFFNKEYNWCPYQQMQPIIAADQRIYSCHDKAYNLDSGVLGSIKDQRFKEFWFNDREKFFSIDPSRDCNHHCVANSKNMLIHEYLEAAPDHLAFV
ncbi:radical SAM protein [Maridesulfovibrio ferrireducens]|uniref:radical SAM protein n=1 Tax=Maridesulfovibrio ferrireducens TaxID=246191 RepID=UPI001A1EBBAC|nr:radical SAM protein [Maridesulfovibrio ferrireducens]MBI9109609.1 radical SAM protein [Maridesulfovibrio ferrireducens]